ncbi:MAG TPA: hypothetical protein VM487_02865 [Phycisphaerae bacterium]|nr:hypothetical protein [Phycisphaerae bacterium]
MTPDDKLLREATELVCRDCKPRGLRCGDTSRPEPCDDVMEVYRNTEVPDGR